MSQPPGQRDIWTISRLNAELRAVLDQSFPLLWVGGEISGLATPRSGHLYFSLKDAGAQIRCALFRNKRNLLRFQPRDGDQVVARARISCYEPRGEVQLIIEHLEPAGAGAQQQAFEALKARLAAEGLFDRERKQALPPFPRRLGVVTSASGAALRDVLHVLARRYPALPVLIYPVPVQGAGAAVEIAEALARTIAALKTPIVAAIGHEIDFTIAEFVADRRAPTPSAAAELVSPEAGALLQQIALLTRRLGRAQTQAVRQAGQQLDALQRRLALQQPAARLRQRQQHLDELVLHLDGTARQGLTRRRHRLDTLAARLGARSPAAALAARRQRLAEQQRRLQRAMAQRLADSRARQAALGHQLHIVSPLSTLGRGYAIVQRAADDSIVRDAAGLRPGEQIRTRLARGRVVAEVTAIEGEAGD